MFSHIKQLNIILLYLNYCIRFLFYLDCLRGNGAMACGKTLFFCGMRPVLGLKCRPLVVGLIKDRCPLVYCLLLAKYDDDEPL